MYKNRQLKGMLVILILIMGMLSFNIIILKNKFVEIKGQEVFNTVKEKKAHSVEKYGYSDILECLRKNENLLVKSINMVEDEKCNVEVEYKGDMKLLYSSLYYLNESKNFLSINSININKDAKITNISISFKKNK